MAGGAGVEYYFGYGLPDNDLLAENFRSRDKSWDYGRIALEFFHSQKIPFWEMTNADALVGNEKHDNSRYCFAKANEMYLVDLPRAIPRCSMCRQRQASSLSSGSTRATAAR